MAVSVAHGAGINRRRSLAATLPMTPTIGNCADALSRDGFADLDAIIDPVALQGLSDYCQARLGAGSTGVAAPKSTTNKAYWSRLSDADSAEGMFDSEHPMVSFALQPAVLAYVSRTIGALPHLVDVLLTHSEHTDAPISVSQLWHKDFDDTRTLKVFAYFTDVTTEADGPFTFVPGKISDRFRYSLRSHVGDQAFFTHVPRDSVRQVFGRAGKAFSVETSRCWHMGSRCSPGHNRLLYAATFISYPSVYKAPPPRFRVTNGVSDVHRLVLLHE